MTQQPTHSPPVHARVGTPRVPGAAKAGIATIAFGLVLDASEHSFAATATQAGGFSPGEHAAHFVVLVGMVVVLAGLIADGIHSASRQDRQTRSSRDAIR